MPSMAHPKPHFASSLFEDQLRRIDRLLAIAGLCALAACGEKASVDACATDNGGCDPLTTCTRTAGTRTCGPCPTGYTGDGESGCADVDECATGNGGCDPLVSCTNTAGARTCGACPLGYQGNGETGCADVAPWPAASVLSRQNASCFGGADGAALVEATDGTAPFTYSLNGAAFQPSGAFGSLVAGDYIATVKDANLRTSTVAFTITEPNQLAFTAVAAPVTCHGLCDGQILLNASGGTPPYEFSGNDGTTYVSANPLTGLCAGAASVAVRDANGCLATGLVTLTQPAALTATFGNSNPVCNGACDGQVSVTASGGTSPYRYSFDGGALQDSPALVGVCGEKANAVLVQDANGCQLRSTQTLTDPPRYSIDTVLMVDSNCGFNNGAFTVAANGLNGPFQYALAGGPFGTSGAFLNLYGGVYSVVAVDQLGCTEQTFVGISDVEMDGLILFQTDATCFGEPDGSIEVTNVSGALPIAYELDNSGIRQMSGFFSGLAPGRHAFAIQDGGNCVFALPFFIDQPQPITFKTTVVDSNLGMSSGSIAFSDVLGGSGAFRYSIDGGATFQTGAVFTELAAGTYELAVTDANDCVVRKTAVVGVTPLS